MVKGCALVQECSWADVCRNFVASNCGGSALLWAASLHLAAAIPNVFIFEFGQAYNPFLYDLIVEPVGVESDGFVTRPMKPGLGVELQPDLERKFPFVV